MQTDTVSIEQFIKANGITIKSVRTNSNPNMASDMDHWKVTLRSGGRSMTLTFSKGFGHRGAEPTTDEVLDCLSSDASGVSNANSFGDWCDEYGYGEDSRKAKRTYDACVHQSARLETFLGSDAYETLLWKVERQ